MGKLAFWAFTFAMLFAGCNEVRFVATDRCEGLSDLECFEAGEGCIIAYEQDCGPRIGCVSACVEDDDCAPGFSCEERQLSNVCLQEIMDAHPELACLATCTGGTPSACYRD